MRPGCGINAPGLVTGFACAGVSVVAVSAVLAFGVGGAWPVPVASLLAVLAVYPLGMCALMLYDRLVTKRATADMLVSMVGCTGGEHALDVGCGRGLMLVGAARRLTSGHATGVDLWRKQDQSAKTPVQTLAKARIAGVADRVSVDTADMRDLPFPDAHFDVVLSNWAVHNLDAATDRTRALAEMIRVLRPGGTLILSDIVHRQDYRTALALLGLADLRIIVASPTRDAVLRLVSFGSYQPAAVIGTRPHVALP